MNPTHVIIYWENESTVADTTIAYSKEEAKYLALTGETEYGWYKVTIHEVDYSVRGE